MQVSRPHMPGYGLLGPSEGRGLLPWSWAEERLRDARNYWIATAAPDGRPHAMAVWGIWDESAFFFSTGASTRKARNLAHDPRCVVTTERADEAVIVEGRVDVASEQGIRDRVSERYSAKYGMGFPTDSNVYRVRPEVVFGLIEDEAEFLGAATRWTFEA